LALTTKNLFLGLYSSEISGMIKKIAFSLLFLSVVQLSLAQSGSTSVTKTTRPNLPGTFVLEFGLNRDLTGPDNFSLKQWGSRTVNVYYTYDIRIMKSRFSLVPGIGLSLERLSFKKSRTLYIDKDDSLKLYTPNEALNAGLTALSIGKSALITNFIDVPIELKYMSKPEDPARSFKVAVGARFGFLLDSYTKIKYKDDGETKKLKNKQDFNLTEFRYGLSARVGLGNFSLFTYYNLTNLWQDGKGPYIHNTQKDFPTITVGFSLSSF
jgi:hypothetical protein